MLDPDSTCPHCKARGTIDRPSPMAKMVPLFAWPLAACVVFGGALTTVGLLMIAPLIFIFAMGVMTSAYMLYGQYARCTACGKLVLSTAEAAALAPVKPDHH